MTNRITRRTAIGSALAAGLAARVGSAKDSKMNRPGWDSIVVGAGVFGAWTAWHLRKAGQRVLLLDARHRVLQARVLTRGTVDATAMHPRDVFREAALAGAAALVLFHNHPSGDPLPSPEDLQLTQRMIEAGHLMGITVVDHVILADTTYCSLRDLGKLTR